MIKAIFQYFVPTPPNEISRESVEALRADVKAAGAWGEFGDAYRSAVNVWTRHADRQSREANIEWLKLRAKSFAVRWAVLSCVVWLGAWIVSGRLVAEVPLTLSGFLTGSVAMVFFYLHLALNK
ncbi:hypothetical protein [Burkholderia cepacia]|uniref:hypothetical protein n=1 Tax=Burkholderia cepacia TaxID=292 RepID=UPI0026DF605D|nr:hypothetical protein [Burkholderia cepacia]MDO5947189.1 hypothetical protein [Burkholderia cepacia]